MIRHVATAILLGLATVTAQAVDSPPTPRSPDRAWKIETRVAEQGGSSVFYAIKHNRMTGETLVLSCPGSCRGEAWRKLPVRDESGAPAN
jgi:hypothetical protein